MFTLFILTYTIGATKTYSNRRDPIKRVERKINTLPKPIRSAIVDALLARGHKVDFLSTGETQETPEVANIVGGTAVVEYKYPWFVTFLYHVYNSDIIWLCGGTVYDERTIITAGHCAEDTEQV